MIGDLAAPQEGDIGNDAPSLTILVSSCDLFFDVWAPFFCLWRKFWPDCPFPLYLITNRLTLDDGPVRCIPTGNDKGWASNLIDVLAQIKSKYVFFIQEDQFLLSRVNTERFLEDLGLVERDGTDCLSFRAMKPTEPIVSVRSGIYAWSRESKGGIFCDPAIWKKSVLQALLVPGETAWDFLENARSRAAKARLLRYQYDSRSLAHCPVHYFKRSAVRFQLWKPDALSWLVRNHVPVMPMQRGIYVQSTKLYRMRRKPDASWWTRARFSGFGILSAVTRLQQFFTRRKIARRLLELENGGRLPLNARVRDFLSKTAGGNASI